MCLTPCIRIIRFIKKEVKKTNPDMGNPMDRREFEGKANLKRLVLSGIMMEMMSYTSVREGVSE